MKPNSTLSAWRVFLVCSAVLLSTQHCRAEETPPSERGYHLLRTKAYLPADFDEQVFAELWKQWPQPYRDEARSATEQKRRTLTFSYYGISQSPVEEQQGPLGPALGYVDTGEGRWAMNCLACHGGKVAGKVIPGLPNSHFRLQTLTEDVRSTKLRLFKPLSHLDLGSLKFPLSGNPGTTNSVIFGVILGAFRNKDMSVDLSRSPPPLVHHDVDPPPLWNTSRKSKIYCDNFAPKNHRVLMQFILLPENGKQTVESWEEDFRDILAWIESLEPPAFPFEVDRQLADEGLQAFNTHCAECHGTYGSRSHYPERVIPIEELGTDPVRLQALSPEHRRWLKESWMSRYGEDEVVLEPLGYLAPPLNGIWATAPYLHNGSVPTLWHLLHPKERPTVWRRASEDGYDETRLGLEFDQFEVIPKETRSNAERRRYFDTAKRGKSAAGHTFPDKLNEREKRAVLEYLKTL